MFCCRYELESQGYAVKLDYINKGKQAKLSQQERTMALKAELIEAEALRSEKENEKREAEEPERQALDKYRQLEQEGLKQKEESERSKREAEASQVLFRYFYIYCFFVMQSNFICRHLIGWIATKMGNFK